jgi:hypothetical protein
LRSAAVHIIAQLSDQVVRPLALNLYGQVSINNYVLLEDTHSVAHPISIELLPCFTICLDDSLCPGGAAEGSWLSPTTLLSSLDPGSDWASTHRGPLNFDQVDEDFDSADLIGSCPTHDHYQSRFHDYAAALSGWSLPGTEIVVLADAYSFADSDGPAELVELFDAATAGFEGHEVSSDPDAVLSPMGLGTLGADSTIAARVVEHADREIYHVAMHRGYRL